MATRNRRPKRAERVSAWLEREQQAETTYKRLASILAETSYRHGINADLSPEEMKFNNELVQQAIGLRASLDLALALLDREPPPESTQCARERLQQIALKQAYDSVDHAVSVVNRNHEAADPLSDASVGIRGTGTVSHPCGVQKFVDGSRRSIWSRTFVGFTRTFGDRTPWAAPKSPRVEMEN